MTALSKRSLSISGLQIPKVFGIGCSKTGTKTLGRIFKLLGMRMVGYKPHLIDYVVKDDLEPVFKLADQYDGFQDWPWPMIFRELDTRYPDAYFILTVRKDSATWLRSMQNHADMRGNPNIRRIVYGYEDPHKDSRGFVAAYEAHNQAVRDYFSDRPGKLLEVCWETGSGWHEICDFLSMIAPDMPIPHSNKTSQLGLSYQLQGLIKKTQRSFSYLFNK